jgi:hypothetical protein
MDKKKKTIHCITPSSKMVIEKLTVRLSVKRFLASYGTRGFISVFTEPTTGPYPKPNESSPSLHTIFL